MRKLVGLVLLLGAVFLFSQTLSELNVCSPAGVVKQPYTLRTVVKPMTGEDGTFLIGLEGHIEIFGINLALGTHTRYPGFVFDSEIYAGLGVSFGGLFLALGTNANNLDEFSELFSKKAPRVAFGIANCWKEGTIISSWGRFELSYEPKNLLIITEDGNLIVNEEFDWTDASVTLKIISQSAGTFLLRITLSSIRELFYHNGLPKYTVEFAIPSQHSFLYGSINQNMEWSVGLGLAFYNFNVVTTYDSKAKKFVWTSSIQF